uniref:Uncharacterized protein n=1 Tax=Oryza glaberrima TaxID=4538 RepID=I1Q3D9_ORYGL
MSFCKAMDFAGLLTLLELLKLFLNLIQTESENLILMKVLMYL